ncbi:MAG: biopolymer transporter ExbD [Synechococcales cyanobacterium RM1_1_8]|nr:biopolymer transporter ExbD [Synechococcales cyanobacterium RM1_1_8]
MKLDFDSQADEVRIDLIPLIDVVFCILIFFILASLQLTRQQAISIDLPQASTSALQTDKNLVVSIDRGGQYYVDQQPVTPENLFYTLQGFEQENPTGLMILYADRSATYDNVVQLLDLMRSVGGDRVALATQQPQPGTGTPTIPGLPSDGGLGFPGLPGGTAPTLPGATPDPFADPMLDPSLPGALPDPEPGLIPGLDSSPAPDDGAVDPFNPSNLQPGGVTDAMPPAPPAQP